MSFEYITEKDNTTKKLNNAQAEELALRISADFDKYNSARNVNLEQANALINEIFFKVEGKQSNNTAVGSFKDTKKDWKSNIKMRKVFGLYQTLRAFIWKNVYSNTNSMFDVSGESLESDNIANKQKSALVDCFEKMGYQKTCDKIINYALLYGELITFCTWKKKVEQFRKKIGKEDLLNPKAIAEMSKGKFHFVDERVVYDNAFVQAVNPADFVFDASQRDNWEDCPKIYKSYKNPDDIINNKYYQVSKEVADELRSMVDSTTADSQKDEDKKNKSINGGTVEVLEHWGNLRLADGTLLKNWHCVVVARRHLIRFQRNHLITNPFTYGNFIEDEETKRGISPLYCVLDLALMQEDLMNRTADMQALSENPPVFAPKGFFKDKENELRPGKIIEFGDNLSPSEIQPMQFNVGVFLNDISFISDIISETSGIFPNMAGADEQKAKTATEISTKTQGQLTRLSQIIDIINQDMIIEDVKRIAKLKADFGDGVEKIFVDSKNRKEVIEVDDEVRQGEYRYTYSDRTATTEKSNKADQLALACQQFAKFVQLNAPEVFTYYMEQKGVENPERFLNIENVISPEVQQSLMSNPQLAPVIQQMEQMNEANKQQQLKGGEPQQQAFQGDSSVNTGGALE